RCRGARLPYRREEDGGAACKASAERLYGGAWVAPAPSQNPRHQTQMGADGRRSPAAHHRFPPTGLVGFRECPGCRRKSEKATGTESDKVVSPKRGVRR